MAPPFTPEQEDRIRAIVGEELEAMMDGGTVRISEDLKAAAEVLQGQRDIPRMTEAIPKPDNRPTVEITPAMIEAGLRVLRNCGFIEHPRLIDGDLVRKVLWVALAAR